MRQTNERAIIRPTVVDLAVAGACPGGSTLSGWRPIGPGMFGTR